MSVHLERRSILAFAFAMFLQFFVSVVVAAAAINGMELALLPVAVGIYAARGYWRRAGALIGVTIVAVWFARGGLFSLAYYASVGLVLAAVGNAREAAEFFAELGVASVLALRAWADVFYLTYVASLGLGLGLGMRRHWRYGRMVAAATGAVFAVLFVRIVILWDVWEGWARTAHDTLLLAERKAESGGASQQFETWLELSRFFAEHARDLSFGVVFSLSLVSACIAVSLISSAMRRMGATQAPRGGFRHMRPPEWLVWVAIAVAVLWFVDSRWPGDFTRPLAWNSAVALATVYALNGFSIAGYAWNAFQGGLLLMVAVMMAATFCGAGPFAIIGLFDTWFDFRKKIHRLAALGKELADGSK